MLDVHDTVEAAALYREIELTQHGGIASMCALDRWVRLGREVPTNLIWTTHEAAKAKAKVWHG